MKNILYLVFVGVIIWVVYATFFGNSEDRAMRDRLFKGLKETGSAITDILHSQKGKYNAGEYDQALEKISGVIAQLKQTKDGAEAHADELAALERQKAELEQLIGNYEKSQSNFDAAQKRAADPKPAAKRTVEKLDQAPVAPTTAPMEQKLEEIQRTLDKIEE